MKATGPANDLERAIHFAAQGAQGYPELFRQLLDADLTVIVPCHPNREGTFRVTEGGLRTVILWKTEDEEVIPVFTSPERAREAITAVGRAGRPFCLAQTGGHSLYKVLQGYGTAVVINPACDCAEMRLGPPAVSRLANRSILRPCDEAGRTTGDASMVHPADFPAGLMEPVFHFLRGRPEVQAAWLLQMKPAQTGEAGLYVFAVLSIDPRKELEGDLMIVLDNAGSGDVPCGMTLLDPRNPSHADLIAGAAPFYAAPSLRFRGATPGTNRMNRLLRGRH